MIKKVLYTPDAVKEWLASAGNSVAFDTETTSLDYLTMDIVGCSFANNTDACYIPLPNGPNKSKVIELIKDAFQNQFVFVAMHNAPFDLTVLYKIGIKWIRGAIFCTQIGWHLIDEEWVLPSLKDLAVKILNVPATEVVKYDTAIGYGQFSESFYNYAMNDAIWTWQLYKLEYKRLRLENLTYLMEEVEMPFVWCLRDLNINGILVDKSKVEQFYRNLKPRLMEMEIDLLKTIGAQYYVQRNAFDSVEDEVIGSVNLNSSKQLVKVLQGLGIKLTELTDKKAYSVDKFVLESLRGEHPFIDKLLLYRKYRDLMNKFIAPAPEHIQADGRMRPEVRNTATVTGRLSYANPNLQQLPRQDRKIDIEFRDVFCAPKGKVLIAADYDGQELRVLTEVSRDANMIKAFKRKQDLHLTMANKFFKLNIPDDVLIKEHPDYNSVKDTHQQERDRAKTINFGIAYGKTPPGFAKDWNVPVPEAIKIVNSYFEAAPGVKTAIQQCKRFIYKYKYIINKAGRRRRFKDKITGRACRQAFNFLIQGYSADMIKIAMSKARNRLLLYPEFEAKLVLTVHDEMIFEVNEKYAEAARRIIIHEMENAVKLCIPLVANAGIGKSYSEAK